MLGFPGQAGRAPNCKRLGEWEEGDQEGGAACMCMLTQAYGCQAAWEHIPAGKSGGGEKGPHSEEGMELGRARTAAKPGRCMGLGAVICSWRAQLESGMELWVAHPGDSGGRGDTGSPLLHVLQGGVHAPQICAWGELAAAGSGTLPCCPP